MTLPLTENNAFRQALENAHNADTRRRVRDTDLSPTAVRQKSFFNLYREKDVELRTAQQSACSDKC